MGRDNGRIVQPIVTMPSHQTKLMERARFQVATAEAIDQHAKAIATLAQDIVDLKMDLRSAREFMADLSVRIDALDKIIQLLVDRGTLLTSDTKGTNG